MSYGLFVSVAFLPLNVTFHVIELSNSNATSCQNLCLYLQDCFITSVLQDACVVGIVGTSAGAYTIKVDTESKTGLAHFCYKTIQRNCSV